MKLSRNYSDTNTILVKTYFTDMLQMAKGANKKEIFVVQSILNVEKESLDKTYDVVTKSDFDLDKILDIIDHAVKIRPQKYEILFELLSKVVSDNAEKMNTFQREDLWEKHQEIFQTMKKTFTQFSLLGAIINDNVDDFTQKMATETGRITFPRVLPFDYPDDADEIEDSMKEDYSLTIGQIIALFGAKNCFNVFFEDTTVNPNTLVQYAIAGGSIDIIQRLKHKVSFGDCLQTAVKYHRHKICDWLLDNYTCNAFSFTECDVYHNTIADLFLNSNLINEPPTSYIERIGDAISYGRFISVKYIIDYKSTNEYQRINIPFQRYFCSPMEIAVINHLNKSLEYLSNSNSYCCKKDCLDGLSLAIDKGYFGYVRFFFDKYSFSYNTLYGSMTFLEKACSHQHADIIKYLVENGADVNKSGFEYSPLDYVVNNKKIFHYLKSHGAKQNYGESSLATTLEETHFDNRLML